LQGSAELAAITFGQVMTTGQSFHERGAQAVKGVIGEPVKGWCVEDGGHDCLRFSVSDPDHPGLVGKEAKAHHGTGSEHPTSGRNGCEAGQVSCPLSGTP
jgi:hypothetical protein